jgi:hypothetical protein
MVSLDVAWKVERAANQKASNPIQHPTYGKTMNDKRKQNPVAVAMAKRHAHTQTSMTKRGAKRAKDARKSWKREEW